MGRTGTVERKTKETEIVASVDLEGSGKADIETGMPFFRCDSNFMPSLASDPPATTATLLQTPDWIRLAP